jgi:hypothetical protein
MGHQIRVFLTANDTTDFENLLLGGEKVIIINRRATRPVVEVVGSTVAKVDEPQSLFFYLVRKNDLKLVSLKEISGKGYWAVDEFLSPVVEFTRSNIRNGVFLPGRLFFNDVEYDDEGQLISKAPGFAKWANRLLAKAKRILKYDKANSAYFGTEALSMKEIGFPLRPYWGQYWWGGAHITTVEWVGWCGSSFNRHRRRWRTINTYSYVRNSPLNLKDPFGLQDDPVNYLRDPFSSEHWIGNGVSNTVSDMLGLDSVAGWGWTIGDYRCSTEERYRAGAKLAGWTAVQAFGGYIVGRGLGIVGKRVGNLWGRFGNAAGDVGKSFKPFTRGNFRTNLAELTGVNPLDSQAHHVFPQQFVDDFVSAGINIHEPQFGSWWETAGHQANKFIYNQEWSQVLRSNPSAQQMMDEGRRIMGIFGIPVNY